MIWEFKINKHNLLMKKKLILIQMILIGILFNIYKKLSLHNHKLIINQNKKFKNLKKQINNHQNKYIFKITVMQYNQKLKKYKMNKKIKLLQK